MSKPRKELRTRHCKQCNETFKTRYDNKEFCSANCKGKWHYQQGRDALRELVRERLKT